MAKRATFEADFTQWDRALAKAQLNLHEFEATGKGVQTRMQRMFDGFSGGRLVAQTQEMARAIKAAGGVATLTDKELRKVTASVDEVIQRFDRLGKDAPSDIRQLNTELMVLKMRTDQAAGGAVKMDSALDKVGPTTTRLGSAMSNLSSMVLRYAGPAAIGAAIINTGRWAAQLDDLSAKTNISTGVLQRMTYAAETSGVSLDTATTAVAKMAQLMGDRDKGFVAAVQTLGLSFDQLRSQDPGQTFLDLAAAVERVQDPYQRAALKQDLFGRGAKELDGFIKDLSKTLKDDLPIASEETIKKLGEFDDAMSNLKVQVKVGIAEIIGAFSRLNDWFERHPAVNALFSTKGQVQLSEQMFGPIFSEVTRPTAPARPGLSINAPLGPLAVPEWAAVTELTRQTKTQTRATDENTAALRAHRAALLKVPTAPASFANLTGPFAPQATLGITPTLFGSMAGRSMANAFFSATPSLLPSSSPWANLLIQAPNVTPGYQAPKPGPLSGVFGNEFGASLGTTILGAFMGGGNIGQSIGGMLGGSITKGLGKAVTAGLGGALGAAFGSVIPGLGTLLGGAVGSLFDKLFGGESKKTREMRDAWLQQAGGLDAVRKMADYAGVSIDKLLSTKKTKTFEAEVRRLEAAFKATQERVQKLVGDLSQLSAGGGIITQDLILRLQTDQNKPEVQQAAAQFLQQQANAGVAALTALSQTTATISAQTASALAGAAGALFEQLRQNGATLMEALRQIEPAITALAAKLGKLGIGGGEAFDLLLRMTDLVKDEWAGPLLDSVDQVGKLLVSLTNTGWITEEMFAGLAAQAGGAYQQLIAGGKNATDVMKLMQPTLQRIWELQQQFGWAVDETTQNLIDEAVQAGIVGEKFKSPQQQMIDALNKLIERFDVLLETMGVKMPDAAKKGADGVIEQFERIRVPRPGGPGAQSIAYGGGGWVEGPVTYARGGVVGPPSYLALGGWPFTPRGTDTVPAMLTPGEFVVSAPAAATLGSASLHALNQGQLPIAPSPEVNVTITIQALDSQSVRDAVEREVAPALIDLLRQNTRGLRTDTRYVLGVR